LEVLSWGGGRGRRHKESVIANDVGVITEASILGTTRI